MTGAHSVYSPSSAGRWLYCPASISFCKDVEDSPSIYSAEGTVAHLLFEMLCNGEDIDGYLGTFKEQDGFDIEVTEDMIESVNRAYSVVAKRITEVSLPVLKSEVKLVMDPVINGHGENIFGTSDLIIIDPFKSIDIYDYKHGKGVAVDAEQNEQMIVYAFGALDRFGWDFEEVNLHILQPRGSHPDGWHRVWESTPKEIESWIDVFQDAIDDSVSDAPRFGPGEKQCRFCPKGGNCAARYKAVQEVAAQVFNDTPTAPEELNEIDLSNILDMESMVRDFFKQTGAEALIRAQSGVDIPGYKLVRANTNRRYIDKEDAVIKLKALASKKRGVKVGDVVVQSPISFTKAIKLLGADNVSPLIEKPEGAIVLAPQNDKRDAVDVFTDVDTDNES